ncbi:MAG: insulinase family protein [Chlorobiaceae bacterium]|nr:insulinase family protein [Chlorobiaceae bacterium]NTV61288.1 insulinase family protein [Chlorobiaceae bacterium]
MAKEKSRTRCPDVSPETVRQDVLPNGLRIVTDEVPHVRSVTIGIQIEAGSRDDPDDKPGLAHFIEHAVFKGTDRRTWLDIAKNIEKNGGYLDAYTTKEHTCIYLRCLESHIAPSFDLLADLVCSPLFPPEEIEKEKEVVIEEISSVNDTPEELIFDDFDLRSFPGHPIGKPILGTEKSIDGFSGDDLKGFMRDHYFPANMLVTATGSATHEMITGLAAEFLGHLPSQERRTYVRKPFGPSDYTPFKTTLKKPVHQSQIVLGTAIERNDQLFYGLMVLNTILGNGMSSLLNLELREKRGLVYNVYSSLSFFDDMTALNIYAGTDGNKTGATLELVEGLLGSDALFSPDPDEVESAKRKLLGSLVMGMEKMTRRMSQTASDISYFGRYVTNEEKTAAIERVTADDIARAAETLLHGAPFSTLVYKPKR